MSSILNVSFQVKNFRKNEKGFCPVYARITLNNQRTEFSIKRTVDPVKWISNGGFAKGTTEEVKSLNLYLMAIRNKLQQHHQTLIELHRSPTVEDVKNAYFGVSQKSKTVVEVFEFHNNQMKELLGSEFAPGTYERYCTALSHVKNFIQWKYYSEDLELKHINYEFISQFEFYLKTVKKCCHNTAIKYITNLKKVVRICIGNAWLERDPFIKYKITLREVERQFLSEDELNIVANKVFSTMRLEQVRDIFLFCCFTGLAYADVSKLSQSHVSMSSDGEQWIRINRTKTDSRSNIPLLPIPLSIIEKYKRNESCIIRNRLLPVLTNQKMNGYLKEIADLCGINKNITSHLARHTFATTVTLTNGVPIESVSKMMGHKSLRSTQLYAKAIDIKVSADMKKLKQVLTGN